jgi:hypothetical protein
MPTPHRRHRSQHRRRLSVQRIRRLEGGVLLLLAVVGIVLVTLLPGDRDASSRACLACGPHPGAGMLLNVVLFVPVGMALALLGTPWRAALAIAFSIALVVEILQLVLPAGHIASVSDVAMNVTGTALGLHLTRHRRAILYPRSRSALRFVISGAMVWLLVLLLTAVGLRPSVPRGDYTAQLSPDLDGFADHAGQLFAASLSGIELADGIVPGTDALRDAMRTRTQLDAQVELVPGPGGIAPLVRVVDDADHEVALLAQHRNDLIFRARVLATKLRLVTPSITMFDALARVDPASRRSVLVNAQREGGALRLSAYGREATLGLHSGVGWIFLAPPATALHRAPDVASMLWVGLPLFLIGYWTGRRARRKARRAGDAFRLTGTGGQVLYAAPGLIALVAMGLAGISIGFGLAIPAPLVWAGAFTALGIGMAAGITTALSHDDRAHGASRPDASSALSGDALSARSAPLGDAQEMQ